MTFFDGNQVPFGNACLYVRCACNMCDMFYSVDRRIQIHQETVLMK